MARIVQPDGPCPARIMIVGEAPGADEEIKGRPFVGASGMELDKMLGIAGISRGECFVTNVARERPPNNDIGKFILKRRGGASGPPQEVTREITDGLKLLAMELDKVRPNVILAFGNLSLWYLTGRWGITKWRGSMLHTDAMDASLRTKVIPSIHPASVLRQYSQRPAVIQDIKRAKRFINGGDYPVPPWRFFLRPSLNQVYTILHTLKCRMDAGEILRLSFDLETRAGHIACAGLSWSLLEAICIPYMCVERQTGYWNEYEEHQTVWWLYQVLCHPNARVVGQNILYDSQYTHRHWHFVPNVAQDCMISQHSIFSSQPKNLAYQASMYANYYVYWKDEGKDWAKNMGEDQLWNYNCLDCVYTDEVGQRELEISTAFGLSEVHKFQQSLFWPVLKTMLKGCRIDLARRAELVKEVEHEVVRRHDFIRYILGHDLNPASPKQMHALFYTDLQQRIIFTRPKKGEPARPTLDDDALRTIAHREPILKPLLNAISDLRTMGIFLSNFLEAPLDADDRMRCAYNIGGSASGKSAPKTYRLSSSENAFGGGANLQTIPSEKSKSVGKAAARGAIAGIGDPYSYPNIREIFIPDDGMVFFDADLDRADLQVVAWECNDDQLKAALRLGTDIHLLNAFVIRGREPPPLEELTETHPRYWTHRGPMKLDREFSKVFCHATNYGGKSRTIAAAVGRTVAEVERAQKIWFGAHPGIQRWHTNTQVEVNTKRYVENKFGFRWYIFDRTDEILGEALAWKPQSTVSVVINKIWSNINAHLPEVDILLQTHDSLSGQFPRGFDSNRILAESSITVPYQDPLVIPLGIKTSERSWGHCG